MSTSDPPAPKRKANKGKAPLEPSSKKRQVDKSLELLSLVSSIQSSSAVVTFGVPRSDGVSNSFPLEGAAPPQVTPLHIQS